MKSLIVKIGIIALSLSAFAMQSHASDWELAKDKKGVKVFTKDIPGSPLKAFRGETVVTAKITDIAYLFNNAPAYTKWLADVKFSKLVKKVSDTDQYVYLIQNIPLLTDRDVIAHGIVTQNPKTLALTVNISAASGMVKEDSKYVRIPKMDGKFIFTPIAGGKLNVVYELAADPGGSIPSALANTFAVDTPYKTLINLKKISADLSKYRDPNLKMQFKDAS